MPVSTIVNSGTLPVLTINGAEVAPCGYMSYQAENADYTGFVRAGYKLLFVPVYAGDRGINPFSGIRPFYSGFWKGEGRYDFSSAEKVFRLAIGNSKPGEVWIIPRLMLEPPTFWEKAYPQELCRDAAGASVHQSYSSEVWFRSTSKAMGAFQDWLYSSGLDEFVVGWQLACGWTEEFMRPMTHPMQLTDYSVTSLKAWRMFLRDRYGTVDALNASWKSSYERFDDISVPTPALRLYVPDDSRKIPVQTRDYNRFRSVETANALVRLAAEAKRITGGQRVIGAFYGYAGTRFGHDAIDIVLGSKDVDFLASPFAYDTDRAPGTDWVLQGALGSCRLHGKVWFTECDVRTHLSRPISEAMPRANPAGNTRYEGPIWLGPQDEQTAVDQLKKAIAKTISCGAAMWWFDMWGGWFKTPAYMECIRRSLGLYRQQAGEKTAAKVALVYDTYAGGQYADTVGIGPLARQMAASGAAFEQYALSDFELLDPDGFRAVVFLNVGQKTDGIERWRNRCRSLVYVNCSGDNEASGGYMARCADGSVRVHDDWQEYRFGAAPASSVLREAFLAAGVHIYAFTDDIIYAYGTMVAIHAATDGEKRIYLPHKAALVDAFTDERPEPCEHFTDFYMRKGETRVFTILADQQTAFANEIPVSCRSDGLSLP
ncbi:MAG: beta-galactosidase [Clostridiales bacterium]|nr:beta-galactosidase [Clostridiales bacterium]